MSPVKTFAAAYCLTFGVPMALTKVAYHTIGLFRGSPWWLVIIYGFALGVLAGLVAEHFASRSRR